MKNNSLPDDRNWKYKHVKLFFELSPPRTPTVTLPGNLCLLPFEASESACFASDTGENSFKVQSPYRTSVMLSESQTLDQTCSQG